MTTLAIYLVAAFGAGLAATLIRLPPLVGFLAVVQPAVDLEQLERAEARARRVREPLDDVLEVDDRRVERLAPEVVHPALVVLGGKPLLQAIHLDLRRAPKQLDEVLARIPAGMSLSLGCDLGQGYLYARPLQAPDLAALVVGLEAAAAAPVEPPGAPLTINVVPPSAPPADAGDATQLDTTMAAPEPSQPTRPRRKR